MAQNFPQAVVGLIPAGGQASRIAPLPCSKELYPVGFRQVDGGRSLRPKVVCHYLLEKMRLAGITRAYIVLRQGKWDIPSYLGDGKIVDMHLAYLMLRLPYGVPYTLDQAYPFVQNDFVAFGFPDIIFQPDDGFEKLLKRQSSANADIVLGVFPAERPEMMDMVDVDDMGRVHSLFLKPTETDLHYAWIFAVWTPAFTSFMHEYLTIVGTRTKKNNTSDDNSQMGELTLGHVIKAAVNEDLKVEAVVFQDHMCLDIGTPNNLVRAIKYYNGDSDKSLHFFRGNRS
jgi:glucose-1-phosphate thymidylyltransferase